MTTITRFHVSWLQTSALPELVRGPSGTPALGTEGEYAAFEAAPTSGATWVKPWGGRTRGHHYWSNLLSSGYQSAGRRSAWTKQAPLRRAEGFTPRTDRADVTVACERYVFSSGAAVAVTATFEGQLTLAEAVSLHADLCREKGFFGSDGVLRRIAGIVEYELDALEREVLGKPSAGSVRGRQVRTVTTIAGTSGRTSSKDATRTLQRLCYPGETPGETNLLPKRTGKDSGTMRATGQYSQASWAPDASTTVSEREGFTCYHHNVVLAALHTQQLLNLVEFAGDGFGSAPDRAKQLYRRAGAVLGWLYGGASAYSTRFTPAQVDASGLVDRINRIRFELLREGPLHLRDS